ncbi:MAG TPA: FGGY-family carbohydrate kinase [Clostridia bacterium]|nr:FGGY-family carbohydrate kinase [Clostridia bacterium]
MLREQAVQAILSGKTALGIELGSTRIKSVLIGPDFAPLASGSHSWENRLEGGIWTYHLEDVWLGIQDCYQNLTKEVHKIYGVSLETIGAIGLSAMMHGYLAFNGAGELLVPFRTWRNTMTARSAEELTSLFQFNIPQRWSIAHLDQAILNCEPHVKDVCFLTTLAGYVHWKLTGEKVLGVGDASGVFPVDSETCDYNHAMIECYDQRVADKSFQWKLKQLLPRVLPAGEQAGTLTPEGALLLDPSGTLPPGISFCPPEGDAGTGMVATNSVGPHTGNISAGTSVFAMIVLEQALVRVHPEIDMVTTPTGLPVAMVHCNNFTSDLDAWVSLFKEVAATMGDRVEIDRLFEALYRKALEGEPDCGGLMAFNYYAGEPITGLEEGRPLFMRLPDSRFTLANFMRAHIFSAMGTLKMGMDILTREENVRVDRLLGHGGFFRTKGAGQRLMAAAMCAPVTVMENAGEGGAWGIALLADYLIRREPGEKLEDFLVQKVFSAEKAETQVPYPGESAGFDKFMERYTRCLAVERVAVDAMK